MRKDGTPYISHPVAVAKILAELDFDSDMISAALLHDVVEDCNYTIEQIKQHFNDNVANIVDAVTAIEDNQASIKDIFYDENFKKDSLDDQTFNKLIALGEQNKLAFYIKFADRLHNLRTIGTFSEYKQVEKVKETIVY
jgi:GTP pyrophosphokinase